MKGVLYFRAKVTPRGIANPAMRATSSELPNVPVEANRCPVSFAPVRSENATPIAVAHMMVRTWLNESGAAATRGAQIGASSGGAGGGKGASGSSGSGSEKKDLGELASLPEACNVSPHTE